MSKLTSHSSRGTRSFFQRALLSWYNRNKRDLPWRIDRNPYRVWLSEIMLQQTRVAAVIEYYHRFLEKFPDVRMLAVARESSVLAAWSGLGYYRRARMLHATAKQIVNSYDSKFPSTADQLRKLPGVGRYTAAAVASIAFDEPIAVVDGNVERVIQRLLGEKFSGDSLWQEAGKLLNSKNPGDFNQAMMELGATICLPREPLCLVCPVNRFCAARGPLKSESQKDRQKKREIAHSLDHRDGRVFLVRRPKTVSLMPGMWELPETPNPNSAKTLRILKHSITVTDYKVRVIAGSSSDKTGKWIPLSRLEKIPLTGLTRKILKAEGLLN